MKYFCGVVVLLHCASSIFAQSTDTLNPASNSTTESEANNSTFENVTTTVSVSSTTMTSSTTEAPSTTPKWEFVGPIRKCPKGTDEELNKCFELILQDLKPRLAAGISEIDLPPLDPLSLAFLDFHQGSGAVVITSNFTNIKIRGLSNFTRAQFKLNTKSRRLLLEMDIPTIRIDGTYHLGGNIFFIPIGGSGPYWFQVGDVKVKGYCDLKLVNNPKKKDNSEVVNVQKIKLDLDIATIKVQLLNLFNGNQILGPVINNVLNENSNDLFRDIKPAIEEQVGGIVKIIVNSVVENLTFLNEFFH